MQLKVLDSRAISIATRKKRGSVGGDLCFLLLGKCLVAVREIIDLPFEGF